MMSITPAMILREKSSLLVNLLHFMDGAVACIFLAVLVKLYGVEWSFRYLELMAGTFLICLLAFNLFQLYRSWNISTYLRDFIVIFSAWGCIVGIILFVFFLMKTSYLYSRSVILTWFILTPVLIFIIHVIVRIILKTIKPKGIKSKSAVIVGAGVLGRRLAQHVESIPWTGICVQGFFYDGKPAKTDAKPDMPWLGKINSLPRYLSENGIDYVYVALPMREESKIRFIVDQCRTFGAELYVLPDLYTFAPFNAQLETLGDLMLLNFNPDSRTKRCFDLVFSIMVLLLCIPIFPIISAAIKLSDGGPIFYRHKRITSAGRVFWCLKFRTMCVDADEKIKRLLENNPVARSEWEKTFKLTNDPRITWIGKFLRKTSLDELPQFINVIKGEMSVVGARPIVHAELRDYYKERAGLYCSLRPGITGPWQVGKRSDIENYEERVQIDAWYALNRSFWLDLRIIVQTVFCMFTGKGAC